MLLKFINSKSRWLRYLAFLAVSTSGCFGGVVVEVGAGAGAGTEPAVQHRLHPHQPPIHRGYGAEHPGRHRPAGCRIVAGETGEADRLENRRGTGPRGGVPAAGGEGGMAEEVKHPAVRLAGTDMDRGGVVGTGATSTFLLLPTLLLGTVKARWASHSLVN